MKCQSLFSRKSISICRLLKILPSMLALNDPLKPKTKALSRVRNKQNLPAALCAVYSGCTYWNDQVVRVENNQGPVVQSVVSLTSSLRVISLTVLADSIHNILIFFAEKM